MGMGKIVNLTEMDLYKLVMRVINEQDESEYYDITPQEYKQLLLASGYNGKMLSRLKKFGGKKIRVNGDLNLRNLPIKTLGDLYVNGKLDVTGTNIENLDGVTTTGYVSSWNTPLQRNLERIARQKEIYGANERRDNGEWDYNNPNIDEEGEAANALFDMLVEDGEISVLDDDEKQSLTDLQTRLQLLKDRYETLGDNDDEVSEIQDEIDDIDNQIEELNEKNNDVYGLIPDGGHYEMMSFKTFFDEMSEQRYIVGTESQADTSLYDYVESLIDDIGYDGFSDWVVESNIDGDEVARYFEDGIWEDVRYNPDGYGIEKVISDDQMSRLREIESQVEDLREMLNNDELDEDEVEDIENQIEELESEYSDIENEEGEYPESEIEEKVEELLNNIRRDPYEYIKDYGMDVKHFINRKGFIDDVVEDMDYSRLGGYDDRYDIKNINGTDYVIVRLD